MPLVLTPLTHRLRRRVLSPRALDDAAHEVVVVSPSETARRGAAISLPGQFERVQATQPATTIEYERMRLTPGEVVHVATRALRFRRARYLNGVFYAGGIRIPHLRRREQLVALQRPRKLATAALTSSLVGSEFFGHHVVDDSATSLMAAEFGPIYRAPAEAVRSWSHAAGYRDRLGVEAPVLEHALIDDAWVFEDWGMTTHRVSRLKSLRDRLSDGKAPYTGGGLFLRRRGGGAARVLENEEQIEDMLAGIGFEIVDPAKDPLDLIIERCRGAKIVCGVEGSGLAHGLLGCAPDAAFVVLQHPYQFNNLWKDFTDALGMRYAFLVGTGTRDSFRIDPEELQATLDLL